jgi:hypothetical protein
LSADASRELWSKYLTILKEIVAAGPRQARDEPGLHGVRREDHDNRYRFGCLPGDRDVNAGPLDYEGAYESGSERPPIRY